MKGWPFAMPSKPFSGQNSIYVRLLRNRSFTLVWSGQTISTLGDTFFNLAVMWVIYAQSGSALQTALISVIWHISSIVFGPFAGAVADRWDQVHYGHDQRCVSSCRRDSCSGHSC